MAAAAVNANRSFDPCLCGVFTNAATQSGAFRTNYCYLSHLRGSRGAKQRWRRTACSDGFRAAGSRPVSQHPPPHPRLCRVARRSCRRVSERARPLWARSHGNGADSEQLVFVFPGKRGGCWSADRRRGGLMRRTAARHTNFVRADFSGQPLPCCLTCRRAG